ncbi:hypothetical protein, conserved [Babesia ovata]|uniref:Extracellular matrix-binding ebh n=1 Tax=Babesia ovata TaxID=189622 RepID=A0A2H6KJE0_9APIC|nr:uncharacterized protein BOVATA_046050 [Babesia ovata]GBE63112.1 hypothetical protein, conserved [Babesia ovata]
MQVENVHRELQENKIVLGSMVQYVQDHFREIQRGVGNKTNGDGIEHNWHMLKGCIELHLKKIYKSDKSKKEGHLGDIENAVREYAGEFKKGQFKFKVEEWTKEVLKKGGTIYSSIDGYVEINKGKYFQKSGTEAEESVIKHIRKVVDPHINSIVEIHDKKVEKLDDADVSTNLTKIKDSIDSFASQLEAHIKSSKFKISNIVTEIEQEYERDNTLLVQGSARGTHDKQLLNSAVKNIVSGVAAKAQRAAAELEWFVKKITVDKNKSNSSIAAEIDAAIKQVEEISKHMNGSDKSSLGNRITTKFAEVKANIDLLGNIVGTTGQELKTEVDKLQSGVLAKLETLKKYENGTGDEVVINDKKQKAEEKMKHLREQLDEKINYIGEKVNDADRSLKGTIDAVINAVSVAQRQSMKSVQDLQTTLIQKVKDVFNILTNQVQDMFADQTIAHLTALKSLVSAQLAEIKSIISRDRITGPKGLLRLVKISLRSITFDHKTMRPLAVEIKKYFEDLCHYLQSQSDITDQAPQIKTLHASLDNVFDKLLHHQHFHHAVSTARQAFEDALQQFPADTFPDAPKSVLKPLKQGLEKFAQELRKQYVSRYSGAAERFEWTQSVDDTKPQETVPSEKAMKCAKVLVTIMDGVQKHLGDLSRESNNNKTTQIHSGLINKPGAPAGKSGAQPEQIKNALGTAFAARGFNVATDKDKQDGELQRSEKTTGIKIHENLLSNNLIDVSAITSLVEWATGKKISASSSTTHNKINLFDYVDFLRSLFRKYYNVCQHIHIDSPKAPSNIYQMLQWLSGLYFNPMYDKINVYFSNLFDEKTKQLDVVTPDPPTYAKNTTVKATQMTNELVQVCLRSQLTLVAILGHGHADGRYACDFRTNLDKLLYPSNPSACFYMLVDILKRVFHQLHFVYSQCRNGRSRGGWRECHYGRHVGGSSWNCNEKQCGNQACKLSGNQNGNLSGNQAANQMCDQHPSCGMKSPLQSFLEDGLQGFLPHPVINVGCGVMCSIGKHRGLPCKTPMGFSDIGVAASHTKTGDHLEAALDYFCGKSNTPVSRLCSYFICLVNTPPQTLGDMFAFYNRLLRYWGDKNIASVYKSVAFHEAVSAANFGDTATTLDITSIQKHSTHSSNTHEKGDLFSLSICNANDNPAVPCGPYLQSIDAEIRHTFSKEHADKYLSWVVYVTETFYDLLKKLYDECCARCNKPGTRCHDRRCGDKCTVNSAYSSNTTYKQLRDLKHEDICTSIVSCQNMHPTLYAYGFTFGSPHGLSGEKKKEMKRTCQDFCRTFEKVVKDGSVLYDLVHKHIPQFLFDIREKFIWTLVALWSLSLLYLLHIAVVRLDVLRIRSHLKSPSSHRVAAQSLIAAARVKALANVKYFSP